MADPVTACSGHLLLDWEYDDNTKEAGLGCEHDRDGGAAFVGTRCRDLPPHAAVEAVFTKAFPITIEGSPETLLGIHHVGFCIVVDGETFMLDFAPLQFYKRHYARRARGRARWDAMMDSVAPELVKTKPGSAQRVPETCVPHIRFAVVLSPFQNTCRM